MISGDIKKIETWITPDGRKHQSERSALLYVAEANLRAYVVASGIGDGGILSKRVIEDWIVENAQDLQSLTTALKIAIQMP